MASNSVGIIALTDRAWTDRYMSEANLMIRLARRHTVVWVTPAHHWRNTLSRLLDRSPVFRRLGGSDSITVYRPPVYLPSAYRPEWLSRWFRSRRLARARQYLLRQGCDKIVLYVWRPKYANALELVPHDVSVYHIVDEYSFSQADPPTSDEELGLIRSADELIVHSPALLDKKGRGGSTSYIPNGVDYEAFSSPCAEPADLENIPHPRIGYCGYLKRQLDWDLLTRLIEGHSECSWVFVGALAHKELAGRIEDLDLRPNVYFLGGKTSHEFACYPQHFDVCIMPYTQDAYTRYIFPLKLHEYLASGRPTVGTPIRSLLEYEGLIELADGIDGWTSALEKCLAPAASTSERVDERRQVARASDWNVLADQVDDLLGGTAR